MNKSFLSKLTAAVERNGSLLCIGLDPDPHQFPDHFASATPARPVDGQALLAWGRRIMEQTADLACCYKPNSAFYEQFGAQGIEALRQTIAAAPDDIPVLLDAKRGDIGSTAAAYARAAFEALGADAVTLSPYLGRDSVAPFLAYPGKMAFVLCYTSNPSAATIQEAQAGDGERPLPLFERVVREALTWGGPEQIGLVVGATQPLALARVRQLLAGQPRWILAPGVGAQGGDLSQALAAGLDAAGSGLLIPVSRQVIYAADPRAAAQALRAAIRAGREPSQRIAPTNNEQPSPFPSPPPSFPSFPSPPSSLILALHEAGCVQFGDFTLASGVRSPIYLDLRRMASRPELLQLATNAYLGLLRPLTYDCLAAVPYAALTIGTAVALASGKPLIYPRKEAKGYGSGQMVEGVFSPGDQAVVIEDLVTSGGSVLQAIETLEAAGLAVRDVVVLIDRQQGGPHNLAAAGYRLHAALTMSEIVETLRQAGRISAEQATVVKDYLAAA